MNGTYNKDAEMQPEDEERMTEGAAGQEAGGDAAVDDVPAGAELPEENELEAAQQEIAELQDRLLRLHADMENLRKRTQREVADAHKFSIEKFATALLDVVDNLERALEVEDGNEKALRDGIQLTLDSWHKVMERFQMERIEAVGESFDPHHHEALSQMPHEDPAGTVIAQHVAGYKLNGRLIRPAKVLVSSGHPGAAVDDEQASIGK